MDDYSTEEANRQLTLQETQLHPPAKPKLQLRILHLLAKSHTATTRPTALTSLVSRLFFAQPSQHPAGLETTKLLSALFNFLTWTSRLASDADKRALAPLLTVAFTEYITVVQGRPHEAGSKMALSRAEVELRGRAYEALGIWGASLKFEGVGEQDADGDGPMVRVVKFLLWSLRCDGAGRDVSVSIEGALGALLNRLAGQRGVVGAGLDGLRGLLVREMGKEIGDLDGVGGFKTVRSAKFAALRFANRCLEFADCEARWLDLVAIGAGSVGGRQELVEEGAKGLDPYWWSMLNASQANAKELVFPRFEELVEHFFGRVDGEKLAEAGRPEYRFALPYAVAFCRNVLVREALESGGRTVAVEPDWEKKMDALVSTNESTRSMVRAHLKKIALHPLKTLIDAALTGLSLNLGRCAEFAVEICSLVPDHVIGEMLDRVVTIKPSSVSNDLAIQLPAARLLGIFASHRDYSKSDREDSIRGALVKIQGWREAVGQDINRIRGHLLCVAFIISRQALRGTLTVEDDAIPTIAKLLVELILESRDIALRIASHAALGQLTLCLDQKIRDQLELQSDKVVEQLLKDAKKEQESAVIAVGRFIRGTSGDQEPSELTKKTLESLYALHEIKRPEVQFTIGEALSVAAAGWHSKATIGEFDLDLDRPSLGVNTVMLERMLDKIISDCKNTKPSLKKASAIWLLCLIQYVGDEPCVQSRLRQCQAAFASLLSSRDEVVQETGSRGLGLVYEMGDKNLKDDLVRDLVASFTGSNAKLGGTVTSETQLFDAGALPTGDGSVTTYKDIVSLAAEMGDPSLVYRFMNLASNNAIWTSRSAFGRFGLGNVLADSAYLAENKTFYPKLYRYRFDPNPNVQRSMNDIWNALVKDPNTVIDQNFDAIIEDLLKSVVTGKEWRVRQASCAAIADIIQGRDIEKYEKYLNEIWTKAFMVLDDIKETVVVAARGLCRTLTNLLIRNLEVGEGTSKRAQKLLDNAMPFLLQLLESGASKELQQYAIKTLLKVVRKSPLKALKPYAPVVLETLIRSLDSLEDERINYLHINADRYGLTAEKLDNMRVSNVSSSPDLQAIERCLEALDEQGMPEAMRRLEASFKSVGNLPSKVGLSRVLVSLTVRHHLKFRAYADRFAQQLRKHLLDRNETVTNSFSMALAYIVRIATDKEVEETSRFVRSLYFASNEAGHRHVAGEIVYAISKVSNDRFMASASAFLPFAFIGRNDVDEQAREPFRKAWEENVGGNRSVSLYLMDIIELAQHIDSAKWGIKHTVACAIADMIVCLDSAIDGDYSSQQAAAIWPFLEKALGGKTWDGKEVVVDSLPKFVKKAQVLWGSKGEQMDKIALREAKRINPAYRAHSINALGEMAKVRGDPGFAQKVLLAMKEVVEGLLDSAEDRMEIDAGEASLDSEVRRDASLDKVLSAAIACSFSAVTHANSHGATIDESRLLMTIVSKSLAKGSRLSHLATYEGIKTVIANFSARSRTEVEGGQVRRSVTFSAEQTEMVKGMGALLLPICPDHGDGFVALPEHSNTETIRMARARALLAYASCDPEDASEKELASPAVKTWLNSERSGPIRDILNEAQVHFQSNGKT